MNTTALPIYPFPVPDAVLTLVKRAKRELGLPFLVAPVAATEGVPLRVLAFGEAPPFICTAAIVRDPNNYDSIKRALAVVLSTEPNDNLYDALDFLRDHLDAGVTELEREGVHFE